RRADRRGDAPSPPALRGKGDGPCADRARRWRGTGGDLAGSYLMRKDATQIPVDLEALLVRRDFTADKPIEMGDSLVVPYKRRSVVVEGAVFKPNAYPYNPTFNVLDYVASAGGETRFAQDIRNAKLITPTGKTLDFNDQ